ncbi:Hsp20/alpha crystallin family protein [Chitinophaga nivalis]|uniref:Hsp20/alpha crystallin family protein n=1 Tax=Chitinophaga nivalis TaxID=2991709 RepID=A0ABT3IPU0_9BACT|nr:Hsp20/alpha crystallin family protein [Chitinophaga nivalis]MCW3464324.1 Hsp20/alpha crystallin family protein [Chitinophaga nivalis]MCW3485985.1 Hsp20/alpha crystallin family protein [Chitinophaga nivalis]
MTHVKFNHSPLTKSFNGIVDDILHGGLRYVKDDFLTNDFFTTHPPVNITETKDAFLLEVVAPGFAKEDFKISVNEKVITISAERKAETRNEGDKQVRREFNFKSFKRSFTITEVVAADQINAKYDNGILKVTLPKKENKQDAPKEIVVE